MIMRRKAKVTGVLALLIAMLLAVPVSMQALAAAGAENEQTEETEHIEYLGRSMRIITADGSTDCTKTSIRFGYKITLPEGVGIEDCTWGWKFTTDGKSLETGAVRKLQGNATTLNYVKNQDGTYTTNLVITNIPSSYYRRNFYAQMFLSYPTGTDSKTETDIERMLNTKELAADIQNQTTQVPGDDTYAKGISDEIATYETMIDDKMYKTLAEAVTAASETETIFLLKDFTVTETIAISQKSITLTVKDSSPVTGKRGTELKDKNVFHVMAGGSLTIDGTSEAKVTVDGCGLVSSTKGMSMIHVADGGAFELGVNAVLTNAKTSQQGGALYVAGSNAKAILSGDVTGNRGAYGGAILINDGANVTIKGGTYSDNQANYNENGQGGVAIIGGNGGTLTVENGEFHNNGSKQNGGVFRCSKGTLSIQNGSFCKNAATKDGGVVSIGSGVAVTINGGTYSENKAVNGGVLHCDANTTMVINIAAGTFNKNQATGDSGGVLYCCGTLNITGGVYFENSAGQYGGMVNISANTKEAKISNATVYDNYLTKTSNPYGGAFYISGGKTLTLSGCNIHDNKSNKNTFPIDITIGNKATLELEDNVAVGVVRRAGKTDSIVRVLEKYTGSIYLITYANQAPTVGDYMVTFDTALSDSDKQSSAAHMTVRLVDTTKTPYVYDDTTYCVDSSGVVQLRQ